LTSEALRGVSFDMLVREGRRLSWHLSWLVFMALAAFADASGIDTGEVL